MNPINWDISTPEGMQNAVEWQTRHVSLLAEGGYWAVPRSMSVYRINANSRTAVKLCGLPEPDIARVFEAMGWKVVEAP